MAKDCLLQVNGNSSGQFCWIYLNPDWNERNQGWFVSGSLGGFQPISGQNQGTVQQLPSLMQMFAAGKLIGSLPLLDLATAQVGNRHILLTGGSPYAYLVVQVDLHQSTDTPHSVIARTMLSYNGQD